MTEVHTENATGTTTTAATAWAVAVDPDGLPLRQRAHDLRIDVQVVDYHTIRLVPRSILAAEVLANLMLPKAAMASRGMPLPGEHRLSRTLYLELAADTSRGVLARDGCTQWTGMSISPEEYAVARAAIDAHREAKSSARKPKAARTTKKGGPR